MKAIIMAGGEGKRLRPLTENRPKPMTELFGRPVLYYTVELLKSSGITDILITLRYMPELIKDYFGDGADFGVNITYNIEETPMGTAGGVRACADFVDGDVLIMSGDAVCTFDLRAISRFHSEKNAEATIAVTSHSEPTSYGLVLPDKSGRIAGFVEKPDWERVVTDTVNTGVYILSRDTVLSVPEGREYDFGRDLFPKMAAEGRGLYACRANGYWCDVGSPEAYRACCMDVLSGRAEIGVYAGSSVYMGKGATVEPGVRIKSSVIGDGSALGRGTSVKSSVLNGAIVGRDAYISGAVLGRNSRVRDGAVLLPGSALGDGVTVGEDAVIGTNVKVSTNVTVPPGEFVTEDIVKRGEMRQMSRLSTGVYECAVSDAGTGYFARLGEIFGAKGRCGAGFSGGSAASALASAFSAGVRSVGGDAVMTDAPTEAALSFGCAAFGLDRAVFIRLSGDRVTLSCFGALGESVEPTGERAAPAREGGEETRVTGLGRAYLSAAAGQRPAREGVSVSVSGSGEAADALAAAVVLAGAKCESGALPSFETGADGFGLEARDETGELVGEGKLLTLAAIAAENMGKTTLFLPQNFPKTGEKEVQNRGIFTAKNPRPSRELTDGAYMAAAIVRLMAEKNRTLRALTSELHDCATAERKVTVNAPVAQIMRQIAEKYSMETATEITFEAREGRTKIRPNPDGKTIDLIGEAETPQKAENLLKQAENAIKATEK